MKQKLLAAAFVTAFSAVPYAAHAQFGGFVPQAQSVSSMTEAMSAAAQTIRDARPVVNEAEALSVARMAAAEADNRLAFALERGGVSLWRLDLGRETRRLDAGTVTALAFSPDGRTLATAAASGGITLWDVERGKAGATLAAGPGVRGLSFSADGSRLLAEDETGGRLLAIKGGKEEARLGGPAALHPADSRLAVAENGTLSLRRPGEAKPQWSLEGAPARLAFTSDGGKLVAVDAGGGLRVIDCERGEVVASGRLGFVPASLGAGFTRAVASSADEVAVVDLTSGAVGASLKPHAKPIAASLALRGGNLVLTASPDYSVRLTAAGGESLGQVVVGRDGWAVAAQSGEFDAEGDGLDTIKWVAGENSFDLDQFGESHFQPGILPRLLTRGEPEWRRAVADAATRLQERKAEAAQRAEAERLVREKAEHERLAAEKAARSKAEQDRLAAEAKAAEIKAAEEARRLAAEAKAAEEAKRIAEENARQAAADAARVAEEERKAAEAKKVVISKEFAMPPQVSFDTPKAEAASDSEDFSLSYAVKDLGGGIEEVRLFQNGKLVYSKAGGETGDVKAKLAQGANEFRLVALSRDRIESRPAKVKVTYTGAERKSTLHVVAVGINKYKNPALNLNYGVGDAKGIADYFARQPKTLYRDVVLHTLYDEQASKANIVALLASLKDTRPEDSVVIYLAGHGDTLNDGWYFMPAEVRYPEREDEVRERGLPSTRINELIKEMGAQKVLMLVDACKSGAALVAFRGFEDRKALMQVARSSGVHVVAAAGKDQFAAELTQLGHGLFTYTLLDGLSGKADRKQSRVVSVRGLTNYVEDQLPEISQNYKGVAQFPVVDSRGMDFPVATY